MSQLLLRNALFAAISAFIEMTVFQAAIPYCRGWRIFGKRPLPTPENVERVRHAIRRSPRRSALKHASALQISGHSVRRSLHLELDFHPYKLVNLLQTCGFEAEYSDRSGGNSPEVLRRVMHGLPLRLEECVEHEGHHLKNVIFKK